MITLLWHFYLLVTCATGFLHASNDGDTRRQEVYWVFSTLSVIISRKFQMRSGICKHIYRQYWYLVVHRRVFWADLRVALLFQYGNEDQFLRVIRLLFVNHIRKARPLCGRVIRKHTCSIFALYFITQCPFRIVGKKNHALFRWQAVRES